MDDFANTPDTSPSQGQHLATIPHQGRFWDVYVEFDNRPDDPESYRAHLAFSPADSKGQEGTLRTAVILIEDSYEEVFHKARAFDARQLEALLRSTLP